jgi:predicted secreted protein
MTPPFASNVVFALFLALSPWLALAGDDPSLNVLGFSKDGKYLAFEQYGEHDGSGFPFSKVHFVDCEKNLLAAPSVEVNLEDENATQTQARDKAHQQATNSLTKLGIVQGDTGIHLLSHMPSDLNAAKPDDAAAEEVVRFTMGGRNMNEYELKLTSLPTTLKDCEVFGFDTFYMELSLTNKTSNETAVLQKDTRLPKSRGCVMDYAIQDVYRSEGFIAVFIRYKTPGFEGPDSAFMAVSGRLN